MRFEHLKSILVRQSPDKADVPTYRPPEGVIVLVDSQWGGVIVVDEFQLWQNIEDDGVYRTEVVIFDGECADVIESYGLEDDMQVELYQKCTLADIQLLLERRRENQCMEEQLHEDSSL